MRVVVMMRYYVIRKEKGTSSQEESDAYGICACVIDDGFLDILGCVENVSKDIAWTKALADKLNRYEVDPIHLPDIIEDEKYALLT